jgi:hypothetical protein
VGAAAVRLVFVVVVAAFLAQPIARKEGLSKGLAGLTALAEVLEGKVQTAAVVALPRQMIEHEKI